MAHTYTVNSKVLGIAMSTVIQLWK